jgi:Fe-S-cluster containining protein
VTPQEHAEEPPWFAAGLRFKCTGCGKCCTGSSGSVYLSQSDLERLAAHFRQPVGAFVRRYTRLNHGRRALIDQPGAGDCVFLKGKACTVYDARPTQCRTYPWWFGNLRDPESWLEAAEVCEGIDHPAATLVPASEILEQAWVEADNDSHL